MLFNAEGLDLPKGQFEGPAERKGIKIRDGQAPDYDMLSRLLAQASNSLQGAEKMTEILQITALPSYPDEIGRWLWAMQEMRQKTLELVKGLDQETLDWQGQDGQENSIGSLLYHIAVVEMSWLHFDLLLRKDFPPEVMSLFHVEPWNGGGLTHVPGISLEEHLGRLVGTRKTFLDAFRGMTVEDWRTLRIPSEEEQVTPEWVVFHLVEHEAGHQYQIASIKRRAKRSLGAR